MRQYNRGIALSDAQRDEEQEERDTRDDIGVQDRDVVHEVYDTALAVAQVVDADGSDSTEKCRHDGCYKGDEEGVLNSVDKAVADTTREERGVQLCREARPVTQDLRLCEREYCDDDDGGIEHHQEQDEI